MKALLSLFSSLFLISCSGQSSLKKEIVLATYRTECQTLENGTIARVRRTTPDREVLKPQIKLDATTDRKISYHIQGHIKTGGHAIRRVKKVETEEQQSGHILIIKHTVIVKSFAGKEGNNVYAENYADTFSKSLKTGIKTVKIELYEKNEKSEQQAQLKTENIFEL